MSAAMNPFVGLRPFEEEDAILFFGRSDQVDELLTRLHRSRFVAVLGSSGSGKSSLVRAGLIPALRGGFLVEDRDAWDVVTMKPGQQPLVGLAAELLRLNGNGDPVSPSGAADPADVEAVAERIHHSGADAVAELALPRLQDRRNLLLVVDQFEELFRFELQRSEAGGAFVETLLNLASRDDLPVYVVLTMRSDFLGECDAFLGLTEAMNRGQYLVPKLTRQRRREAIEGPARVGRQRISARLLDRLLNESEDEPDQLPLLQHVLMRTWSAAHPAEGNGHVLDVEHYESVGGMAGALERDAESALPRDPDRQALAVQVFRALTLSDGSNRQLRRPGRVSELASVTGASTEAVREVIAPFCNEGRSFLTATCAPGAVAMPAGVDDPLIDISHESLIRRWKRLGAWVHTEAESAKIYQRLVDTARLWADGREEPLSGVGLRQMDQWWATQRPTLAWALRHGTESDFDQAKALLAESRESERIREAEAAVARAQQHELARTHAVAKARTKYIVLLGAAFLAVMGAAVQLGASKARLKGYENAWASIEQAATDPRAGLLKAARALDGYPDLVAVQQAVLDQLSQFEGSRLVVDLGTPEHPRTAAQRLFLDRDGRFLAFHLTGSGGAVSASPKQLAAAWTAGDPGEGAAWQTLLQQPGIDRLVASTADGACIVGGTSGHRLTVWQRGETGSYGELHASTLGRPFTRVAVTDDCRWLFVGDIAGALTIFDLRSGAIGLTDTISERDPGAVAQIAASPSGWLAASTATGALAVWRSSPSGWLRSDVSASEGRFSAPVTALRFSADGQQLLVGDLTGRVVLWQLPGPAGDSAPRATDDLPPHAGPRAAKSAVASVDESEDGHWLVVSLQNGEFGLFEREGGGWRERGRQDKRSPSSVVDVRLSPDGRWLAALTEKHTAFLWRLPDVSFVGRSPWRPLRGHRGGEVTDLRFTPDGRWLVSGGADGVIRRWDLAAPDPTDASVTYRARPEAGKTVSAMASSTDARWVATGLNDGVVTVTALTAAFAGSGPSRDRERVACSAQGTEVGSLTISHDNRWLACRFVDGTLSLTALEPGSGSAAVIERRAEVADFSPGSRWLVVGQADGSIAIHDVRARFGEAAGARVAPVASLSVPALRDTAGRPPLPLRVLATEDLNLVATGLDTGGLYVWMARPGGDTVRHGDPEQLLPEAGSARTAGPLRSLQASADGAWVAAVDVEGTAFVWHRASGGTFGRPVLRSSVSQPIRAVAVGDVRRNGASDRPELALVSGASDGTICILPLDARLAARTRDTPGDSLCGRDEPFRVLGIGIHTLDLSGDGKKILARVSDGRVLLFDLARQHAFAVFIGRRYATTGTSTLDAAMTSDGRGVLTLSDDWSVRSWRIDHDELRTQVAAVAGAMTNQ